MNPQTFSALAEPNRLHIVELLRTGPRPVGEIVSRLHLRQPQVSKHLKVLSDAGLVVKEPVANQRIYKLSPKRLRELDVWLEKFRLLWEQRLDRLDRFLQADKKKVREVNKNGV
jgi:DNA-binding transcriptional ArsR family regulator